MDVDWMNFTSIKSLLGGSIIGLSAALSKLFNGRNARISGILGGLLTAGGWRDELSAVESLIAYELRRVVP